MRPRSQGHPGEAKPTNVFANLFNSLFICGLDSRDPTTNSPFVSHNVCVWIVVRISYSKILKSKESYVSRTSFCLLQKNWFNFVGFVRAIRRGRAAYDHDVVFLDPESPHVFVESTHIQVPQTETACNIFPRCPIVNFQHLYVEDVILSFLVWNEVVWVFAGVLVVVKNLWRTETKCRKTIDICFVISSPSMKRYEVTRWKNMKGL